MPHLISPLGHWIFTVAPNTLFCNHGNIGMKRCVCQFFCHFWPIHLWCMILDLASVFPDFSSRYVQHGEFGANDSSKNILLFSPEWVGCIAQLSLLTARGLWQIVDDRRILEAVDAALARRRKALKSLQKEIKKSGSSKVWKTTFIRLGIHWRFNIWLPIIMPLSYCNAETLMFRPNSSFLIFCHSGWDWHGEDVWCPGQLWQAEPEHAAGAWALRHRDEGGVWGDLWQVPQAVPDCPLHVQQHLNIICWNIFMKKCYKPSRD